MNIQLTKDEYEKKLGEYNLGSHRDRTQLYQEWLSIIEHKALHKPTIVEHSVNCVGDLILNSKNLYHVFDADTAENLRYVVVTAEAKDSMDLYHAGLSNSELLYECHAVTGGYKNYFCHMSYDNTEIEYCDCCHNSGHLFGCISVKKGNYMILNKQYSESDYHMLKKRIVEHMKSTGEYGEFFPIEHSPFGYNETQAAVYMPLIRDIALEKGFAWQDDMPGTFGRETIQSNDIPDHIGDVQDTILQAILKCEKTGRNYNIVPQELQFYRQHKLPIPRLHPDERYLRRMRLRPERQLYKRMTRDGEEVLSSYAPTRPEQIVSETFYKQNIL